MSEELVYRENILDHYKHPRNKKTLDHPSVKHRELNPFCGDDITIYLHIKDNLITKATFTGHGCAISQASISLLTEKLVSMTIEEAQKLREEDIYELLGIEIEYTRRKCALLSLKALQKGLEGKK